MELHGAKDDGQGQTKKSEEKDKDEEGSSVSCKIPSGLDEDETGVDDFVPSVEYPPLIPLPPLVNLENPHEDEDILFVSRAKLYCFDNSKKEEGGSGRRVGQWVERGLGLIKILQNKDKEKKQRVRVVMWRQNVNTIACNHWLNCIVSLSQRTERVLLWSALDFAFDCPRVELFSCNFPSPSDCDEFKGQLETFIASIPPVTGSEGSPYSEDVEKLLKPLSDLFAKEDGSSSPPIVDNQKITQHVMVTDRKSPVTPKPGDKENDSE